MSHHDYPFYSSCACHMNGNALTPNIEGRNLLFVKVHVQHELLRVLNRTNCNEKMNFFSLNDGNNDDGDDNYENVVRENK